MKNLIKIAFAVAFLAPMTLFSQTTWKSPAYQAAAMRKVMILAKVMDTEARKQLEDYTAKLLSDKGIEAVAAYSNLTRTKFATREAFLAYADSIKVDGMLVFEVEDIENVTINQPSVSVGAGAGNMYGGYMATSTQIAGGEKVAIAVRMRGNFYTRTTEGSQWLINLSGTLDGPTDKLALSFAKTTAKAMLKDGLFLKK